MTTPTREALIAARDDIKNALPKLSRAALQIVLEQSLDTLCKAALAEPQEAAQPSSADPADVQAVRAILSFASVAAGSGSLLEAECDKAIVIFNRLFPEGKAK